MSFSLHGGLDKDTADAFIRFMAINPLTGEDAEKAGVKKNTPEMGAWLQNQEWERFKSLL